MTDRTDSIFNSFYIFFLIHTFMFLYAVFLSIFIFPLEVVRSVSYEQDDTPVMKIQKGSQIVWRPSVKWGNPPL